MAFTAVERLKLNVGDKQTAAPYFTDAQYANFIEAAAGNITLATVFVIKSMIAEYSLQSSVTAGAFTQQTNLDALNTLLKQYMDELKAAGLTVTGEAMGFEAVAEIASSDFATEEILRRNVGKIL